MDQRSSQNRLDSSSYRKIKRQLLLAEVQQNGTDLAHKLEQLHDQVVRPMEKTKEVVESTVGAVTDTVESAKGFVHKIGEHVSNNPWLMITTSLAAGIGTGMLTTSPRSPSSNGVASFNGHDHKEPGFLSQQFSKLRGLALGAGLAVVRDIVKEQAPDWAEAADKLTQDVTLQLGAIPFTSPILPVSESSITP